MSPLPERAAPPPGVLSEAERLTLRLVCETLFPSILPEEGDDPLLFGLDEAALGVSEGFERALALVDPAGRERLRRLLRALERPLLPRLLTGSGRRFEARSPAERERLLLAMARSRIGVLRAGFQALKRLSSFLFYGRCPEGRDNPAWSRIGYRPAPGFPARAPRLEIRSGAGAGEIEADVCVIGSGAGGGVVAAGLAAAGKRVVVLEAGSARQAGDFDQRELDGMATLYLSHGLLATRDLGLIILAGAATGGGTAVNWQTSIRLPDGVRDEWAARSGCGFFAEESFSRAMEAVEARLGVGTEETVVNPNNDSLRRGCERLGYGWRLLPRNARGCDPGQCGYCVFGCRHGGKQSTTVTYLRDAQATGRMQLLAPCRAVRVRLAGGRVAGVEAEATDPESGRVAPLRVRAAVVVVAAGALHTPLLLMRSGLELPALGRHLHLHPTSAVAGLYPEPIRAWSGPPQSVLCDRFAGREGGYGFRLETAPAHPGLMALAIPWTGAAAHRRFMQRCAHAATHIVLVRDRAAGRVRPGPGGRPVVEYAAGRLERRLLAEGIAASVRVHRAAGARTVHTLHASAPPDGEARARLRFDRNWSTLFSAHQMGSCRMGRDPRTAVCDASGAVFGTEGLYVADASLFPASSGVNPMLTVLALAHHVAAGLA